ncbi:MAG TPA: hypothetical protein QGG18_01400 [Rhodospirillales bacterium]|nr:hypothetical protein [Rhodospirillales bacterium]
MGSALVNIIESNLDEDGKAKTGLVDEALAFVADLAKGVRSSVKGAA